MCCSASCFKWDDRDSNPDALSGNGFSHHYGFRHRMRLWSGLCLDRIVRTRRRPRPSSLYTFSLRGAWLGVVTPRFGREFADFERIPEAVSPPPAPMGSPLCLPIPPSSHDDSACVGPERIESLDRRLLRPYHFDRQIDLHIVAGDDAAAGRRVRPEQAVITPVDRRRRRIR
jgi:hypothetical protein